MSVRPFVCPYVRAYVRTSVRPSTKSMQPPAALGRMAIQNAAWSPAITACIRRAERTEWKHEHVLEWIIAAHSIAQCHASHVSLKSPPSVSNACALNNVLTSQNSTLPTLQHISSH